MLENILTSRGGEIIRVIDIGSCDVNGTYKELFPHTKYEYIGLDMTPGKNVDIAPKNPYCWKEIESNSYDAVISGQTLEHTEFFWLTALEMTRILKPGGFMCLIAPRGFARHRYPIDCYRFDTDGMLAIARWCNLLPIHASCNLGPENVEGWKSASGKEDVMLVAWKPYDWHGGIEPEKYVFTVPDLYRYRGDFK